VRGAFSNWGRGEEAVRGGKGAYIKQPRQRVKDGEFWNPEIHLRSEARPSQVL